MCTPHPQLVEAIQEEYCIFKAVQSNVATPADFLTFKTQQLTDDSISLEEKQCAALSIQYILHGYVFEIEAAQPSENEALNLIYAQAAMLASAVHGISELIPEFSTSLTGDTFEYHKNLVISATARVTTKSDSTWPLPPFIAELALKEQTNIEK